MSDDLAGLRAALGLGAAASITASVVPEKMTGTAMEKEWGPMTTPQKLSDEKLNELRNHYLNSAVWYPAKAYGISLLDHIAAITAERELAEKTWGYLQAQLTAMRERLTVDLVAKEMFSLYFSNDDLSRITIDMYWDGGHFDAHKTSCIRKAKAIIAHVTGETP